MNSKERAAMQQALDVLENLPALSWIPEKERDAFEAITALREALERPVSQEPVAWMFVNSDGECEEIGYGKDYLKGSQLMADFQPLYTAPQPVKEVGLKPYKVKIPSFMEHRSWHSEEIQRWLDELPPLYIGKPVKEVELTDDEMLNAFEKAACHETYRMLDGCKAVIAAHKEKNK